MARIAPRIVVSLFAVVLAALTACGGAGGGRANVTPGTMPAGQTFTGVWHSPQWGDLQLVQTGSQVVGEYIKDERRGRIQGTAQGDILRFEWSEARELVVGRPNITRGRGYWRFTPDPNGVDFYIMGEWGHAENETGGGEWNAARDRRARPRISGDGSAATTSGSSDDDFQGDSLDAPASSSSSGSGRRSSGLDGL